ncbi:MAG TPA: hypothetical protein VGK00_17175 [Anaerolineales bacterium]|jgi:hypothetical protein
MKKTLLWILGIILVLVVVAALVAVPFIMRNRMFALNTTNSLPQTAPGGNLGPMMHGNDGFQHPPVPGFRGGFGFHSGGGRGFNRGFFNGRFSPFGFGFGILGGILRLIPLALFALLIFGVYQLGKRSGLRANPTPAQVPAQSSPVPEQPASSEASVPENNDPPAI